MFFATVKMPFFHFKFDKKRRFSSIFRRVLSLEVVDIKEFRRVIKFVLQKFGTRNIVNYVSLGCHLRSKTSSAQTSASVLPSHKHLPLYIVVIDSISRLLFVKLK